MIICNFNTLNVSAVPWKVIYISNQIKSSAVSSVTISYSFAFIFAHAAAAGARCWGYSPVWKSNTQQRADGQNENQMCGRDTKRCSLETDYHLLLLLVSEIPGNGMLSKNKYAKSASVCLRRRATQLICSVIWNAPHTVVRWIHKASVSLYVSSESGSSALLI